MTKAGERYCAQELLHLFTGKKKKKKPQQIKTWGSSATRESREESTEQHWVTEQGGESQSCAELPVAPAWGAATLAQQGCMACTVVGLCWGCLLCFHTHSTCLSLCPGRSCLSATGTVPERRVCLQHQVWKPVPKEK